MPFQSRAPALGCLGLILAMALLCLMPLVMVEAMQAALARLQLAPGVAVVSVIAIFAGSLINLPVYRIEREEAQEADALWVFGYYGGPGFLRRVRHDTIVAINVGGCVVPLLLASWEVAQLASGGGWPVVALLLALTANVAVCYYVARPVNNVGVMMPGFASPLTAVSATWLLMGAETFDAQRAPVAFVAGVCGPLIGADLLHLRDITKVSVGMLSIGGAGTFDGIVLSGVLAALLA